MAEIPAPPPAQDPGPSTADEAPLGVALAGGRSRRLGVDKGTLQLLREGSNLTLVEWSLARLGHACTQRVVAAGNADDRRSVLAPDLASGDWVADGEGRGPAAGILGAARSHPHRPLLVLGCDQPRIPAALVRRIAALARQRPEVDWIVPIAGGIRQTLCALYRPGAVAALRRRVARGRFALRELDLEPLARLDLAAEGLPELAGIEQPFLNLNTPDDLAELVRLEIREAGAAEAPSQPERG